MFNPDFEIGRGGKHGQDRNTIDQYHAQLSKKDIKGKFCQDDADQSNLECRIGF